MSAIATPTPPAAQPSIQRTTVHLDDKTAWIQFPANGPHDSAIREVLSEEAYPYLDFVHELPGVIIDVGANIGAASILFSMRYPGKRIFAFEPSPASWIHLQANAQHLEGVQAFGYGLFDRDISTRLYQGTHASVTNSVGRSQLNGEEYEDVELRRASTVFREQNIDEIAVLKIDTEGSEIPVLRDIEPWLEKTHVVFLEYHAERDRLEIDRLLTPRFQLYRSKSFLHRGNLTYVTRDALERYTDMHRYEIPRPTL